jgi:polyphosphate kinase
VLSVVGRFLEHSRIYYFYNNGEEKIIMGSADLMPRNLNDRVEVLFEVEDPHIIHYLREEVLATYLADTLKARMMQPDGTYRRAKAEPGQVEISAQEAFLATRRTGSEN